MLVVGLQCQLKNFAQRLVFVVGETVEMFNDGKDRKTLTLGEFRRMSDEARLELITPAGINKILDVVDRYQL